MAEAVIVAAARTPIGRANKGSLVDVDAFALAVAAIDEVAKRSGLDRKLIDDIVLAESLQGGGVIARHAAVTLGMHQVPGLALNRWCAAGMAAVQTAAATVVSGMGSAIIAGGTESMSSMPQQLKSFPASARDYQMWMSPANPAMDEAPPYDMATTVGENTARIAGLSRHDVDAWAARSHERALASIDQGWFEDEIVPVELPGGGLFTTDEFPRRGVTVESLGALPVLRPNIENATVTAGNAAGLNDAAAAVMVTSAEFAKANGLTPLARIRGWSAVGVHPERTGLAPIEAIPLALSRAGVAQADVARFEINEAFACVPVAAVRSLGLNEDMVNVNGSGCSLGHPIAATGARMIVTMLNELLRVGQPLGVVAMCAGGGMGSALVLERL